MKFNHIVCGGTFDHFHAGHKKLLETCLNQDAKITIGITTMAMVRPKQYYDAIESYQTRRKNIVQFVQQKKSDLKIVKLDDIYGPTLKDSSIDAIYVTKDTLMGAQMINNKRRKIGMKPLTIIITPFVLDDAGDKISSERIRQGLISREGIAYYKHIIGRGSLYMPESLKGVLRKPLGRIISSLDNLSEATLNKLKGVVENQSSSLHICVGDMVTYNLKKLGITPFLSVIDGMTLRKALNPEFMKSIQEDGCVQAQNARGTIQVEAVKVLYDIFVSGHKKATNQLYIHGEEDLLALIAILFSPLNTHVWYGQSGKGAIDVLVTENKKQTVYNLLQRFKSVASE